MSGQGQRRILALLYGLLQAAMLALVLLTLDAWGAPPPAPGLAWALVALPLAWSWAWLCRRLGWHPAWEVAGGLALGAGLLHILLAHALPPAPADPKSLFWVRQGMLLAGGAFGWLQGWRLARTAVDQRRVLGAVHWGLGLIMILVLPASLEGAVVSLPLGWLALWGLAALSALWLARRQDGPSGGSAGRGAVSFAIALGATLALGAGLWLLVRRPLLEAFTGPARVAGRGLGWLGAGAEEVVRWLLRLWQGSASRAVNDAAPAASSQPAIPPEILARPQEIGIFWQILVGLLLLGLAVFLGYLVYLALARLFRGMAPHPDEAAPAAGLLELLARAWGMVAGAVRAGAAWLVDLVRRRGRGAHEAALCYRRLERWCLRRGLGRPPSQTPLEHLGRLTRGYPDLAEPLGVIVASFVEYRYGGAGRGGEGLAREARRAWRLVAASRRIRRAQPLAKEKTRPHGKPTR